MNDVCVFPLISSPEFSIEKTCSLQSEEVVKVFNHLDVVFVGPGVHDNASLGSYLGVSDTPTPTRCFAVSVSSLHAIDLFGRYRYRRLTALRQCLPSGVPGTSPLRSSPKKHLP
ncbi:hypothetical protein TNCV_3863651 [Trichonephila clavipes]|uniref:Uncharacterized protein n=1 Tax=Trichonephila clavipes TaxID=2585209 RepID=A0A8X6S5E7_TRICX|nr:hypothetical protein TNCV_3863651 [Trichonephila clavipes]